MMRRDIVFFRNLQENFECVADLPLSTIHGKDQSGVDVFSRAVRFAFFLISTNKQNMSRFWNNLKKGCFDAEEQGFYAFYIVTMSLFHIIKIIGNHKLCNLNDDNWSKHRFAPRLSRPLW